MRNTDLIEHSTTRPLSEARIGPKLAGLTGTAMAAVGALLLMSGTAVAQEPSGSTAAPSTSTFPQSDRAQTPERADRTEISRGTSRQATPGPAETFTGRVTIRQLFGPNEASQVGAALVTFEPGARTAWHRHPRGQRLVVMSGTGRTQVEGGRVQEIGEGDVIWCPPNVRHWHGASPGSPMSHVAIQESENGSPVAWLEHVTDEQYLAGAGAGTAQTRR